MKIKKVYMSFVCYLVLVAFMSVICLEISSWANVQNQKTEIFPNKKCLNADLQLLFEEAGDADQDLVHEHLLYTDTGLNFLSSLHTLYSCISFHPSLMVPHISGQALFISYRTLRL